MKKIINMTLGCAFITSGIMFAVSLNEEQQMYKNSLKFAGSDEDFRVCKSCEEADGAQGCDIANSGTADAPAADLCKSDTVGDFRRSCAAGRGRKIVDSTTSSISPVDQGKVQCPQATNAWICEEIPPDNPNARPPKLPTYEWRSTSFSCGERDSCDAQSPIPNDPDCVPDDPDGE